MAHSRKLHQLSNRIAPPPHRHAAPSAPWPWIDIQDQVDRTQLETSKPPVPSPCDHKEACNSCWKGYPKSLFPNWAAPQVKKSNMIIAINDYQRDVACIIHHVDVDGNGYFRDAGKHFSTESTIKESWEAIVKSQVPDNIRVRAFFVENLSGPILQMLGAKYNIEPFFFTSSLNCIPSRFQEAVEPGEGDHITIVLTFPRSVAVTDSNDAPQPSSSTPLTTKDASELVQRMIDTHSPLVLASRGRQLVMDLLSVHLIRKKHGSVLISYHPTRDIPITTARYLHERIRFAGQSVYWQSIFQKSPDPTFVLLTFIWHTVYAWDEALEALYNHICTLEGVIVANTDFNLTQELHVIRAHHLHYASLLKNLKKTLFFVQTHINPALDSESVTPEERDFSVTVLKRECDNLLDEVNRLEREREMQSRRLSNVMHLVSSTANIMDSSRMKEMTEISTRDSSAMKQIAYLSMVFLPATFVSTLFGMNIQEIVPNVNGTLAHYAETAISFTLLSVYVITAFQSRYNFKKGVAFWVRMGWPLFFILRIFRLDPYAPTADDTLEHDLDLMLTDKGLLRDPSDSDQNIL